MGFENKVILRCDNGCGVEEDYDDEFELADIMEADLPCGWKKNYDNGDTIFGYICGECVKAFEEAT